MSGRRFGFPIPEVIDVHAHAVLPMSLGCAGAAGPEIGYRDDGSPFFRVGEYILDGVRYEGSAFMDADVRVAAMDAAGIGLQMISPNPITYFTRLDAPAATDYARAHNDAIAETAARFPGRLVGAAQLPMQDVPAAIAELERSVRELGLVAAYIDTDIEELDMDLGNFVDELFNDDVPVGRYRESVQPDEDN